MGRPSGRPSARLAMRSALLLALLALLGVIGALVWGDTGSGARLARAQQTVAVAVGDFFFCDPSLPPGACQTVVSVGDTVAWEYRTGSEGHTVTHCGDSCDVPTDSPLWDSQGLSAGQTFSYTFTAPGTYRYYCRFHPDAMRAVVLVEAAPPATAAQTVSSPTAFPTGEASPTPTPTQAAASPTSFPTGEASPSPAPSLGADEDGGGVASWILILAGIGGGVVLLGGGVLAVRRFR